MKKIFAIALALVMVLSMASAFASACTTGFDWTVADVNKCGKAKVDLIPYVKVADGCGGFTWKVSECAGTVAGESVFFAVALIVDGDIDPDWAEQMVVAVETKNIDVELPTVEVEIGTEEDPETVDALPELPDVSDLEEDTVYYLGVTEDDGEGWYEVSKTGISVADDVENPVDNNGFIFKGTALSSNKAEVCVSIVSESGDFMDGIVGDYYVVVTGEDPVTQIDVYADSALVDGELDTDADPIVTYMIVGGEVDEQINGDGVSCAPYTVADVEAFFGLDNNTKVTRKLVNKNFGWEYEQEDCFKWTATTAIVDAECVVAIPKTGDASLLAWLF